MMFEGHLAYVAAAYATGVIVIGGLAAWVLLDWRRQERLLRELEQRGVRRRSARGGRT